MAIRMSVGMRKMVCVVVVDIICILLVGIPCLLLNLVGKNMLFSDIL